MPPGAEAIALRALSTAFQTALLGPALAKACQVLHSFQAGGSSLARAAAGMTFEQMQSVHSTHSRQAASIAQDRPSQACVARASDPDARQQASRQRLDAAQSSASSAESERSRADQQLRQQDEQQGEEEEDQSGSGQLYPLEPLPDQAVCCQRLLQGYSAAWLGLVPTALTPTSAGLGVGPPLEVDVLLQPVGELNMAASVIEGGYVIYSACRMLLNADPVDLETGASRTPQAIVFCLTCNMKSVFACACSNMLAAGRDLEGASAVVMQQHLQSTTC